MSTVSRRSFFAGVGAAALARSAHAAVRPNILWVSCEDTGTQIGCYGDPHAVTPTIDRLASQGVRYTNAYSVAGVCAPSRSGIITGMYPTTLGSGFMRCSINLPEQVKCFSEYLRNAGYYCTNNVKTDYNFRVPPAAWDECTNKAHWKNRPKDKPFFAVFNITTTHESQVRLRGDAYDRVTERLKPNERCNPAALRNLPPYYPDTAEARRDWANYYDVIRAMDYQVADRLKELEDAGLLEDTMVFFWGDHGVGLPRAKRWLYESSTNVPLVARIPEKLRVAGQGRPGSADDQLVSLIDLGPTMLNLAGAKIPEHMQGRAFLGSGLTKPREYVYGIRDRMDERPDIVRMVRDKRYRYLRNYEPHKPYAQHISYMEQGPTMKDLRRLAAQGNLPEASKLFMGEQKPVEELYDTQADPHEVKNLAKSGEHAAVLTRMRTAHEKWAVETRDVGLIPEPEVVERERKLGTRMAILQQPGSDRYIARLRAVVDAVNRDSNPALVTKAIKDEDAAIRYWAVVGAAKTAAAAAANKDRVLAALNDSSGVVRIAAARAAGKHFGAEEQAVAVLVKELASDNDQMRHYAIVALDEMGEKARTALPAIEKARKDTNDYVRRVAEHASVQLARG